MTKMKPNSPEPKDKAMGKDEQVDYGIIKGDKKMCDQMVKNILPHCFKVSWDNPTPTDTQKCKCRCHLPLVTTHLCPDCFNGCPTDTQTEGEVRQKVANLISMYFKDRELPAYAWDLAEKIVDLIKEYSECGGGVKL